MTDNEIEPESDKASKSKIIKKKLTDDDREYLWIGLDELKRPLPKSGTQWDEINKLQNLICGATIYVVKKED